MKTILSMLVLVTSLNTFALSGDLLGECIMNSKENTQILTSIVVDEARAGAISKEDYVKYIEEVMSDKITTCREVSGLAAEQLAKLYKSTIK